MAERNIVCTWLGKGRQRVNLFLGLITLKRNEDGGPLLLEALQRFLEYENSSLHWSRIRACIGVEFELGKKLSEKTRLDTCLPDIVGPSGTRGCYLDDRTKCSGNLLNNSCQKMAAASKSNLTCKRAGGMLTTQPETINLREMKPARSTGNVCG
ncbi:hypothetical protein Tco_0198838 [Tanacetum coccineum]